MNRLKLCTDIINASLIDYSILDVGCRKKELKLQLEGIHHYTGIDLAEKDTEIVNHDLEKPLPFANNSFDVCVALDVIEHLENAHQLLDELIRVSNKMVIISLPNMYHWQFRLKYLFGREISGKFSFFPKGSKDRHRWLTSYANSVKFVRNNCDNVNINLIPIIKERKKSKPLQWIDTLGSKILPNLFAWGALFIIKRYE